ncbi:MAG: SUMF1/EgtB/PvdO family nonheme iron enzyme [Bacteroidales bacterium]|nr:SUMF1/EgtB/PvdO family nonheme iron enzyme [Bacteroidales bacterium]
MKKSICVFCISVLTVIGCFGQENQKNSVISSQIKNEADLLHFYCQYGTYTDPGEYAYLYDNLPDSLPELCRLIRSQYINYGWELDNYRELIPKERWNESFDQANFNGEEPYANCEKGNNRKKPIAVGSFPPNAYGLYDMHGNMDEWCKDWYGEYNMDEKMNPKGPETGKIKVIRFGGFWTPDWRCRSACRAGDPPGNRGAGLSFRIVKDN